MRTEYRANRRNRIRKVLFDMRRADKLRRWEASMRGWKLQDHLNQEKAAVEAFNARQK